MTSSARLQALRVALVAIGVISIVGVYPLILVWPSGWRWQPNQSEYEQMIVGIYATLGVFLIIAARDPMRHLSLIWFTIVSSVVHGAIMAAQAAFDRFERCHFIGDIPTLFAIAAVLAALTPWRAPEKEGPAAAVPAG